MGTLTTHVLDTYHGIPAEGVEIELTRLGPKPAQMAKSRTNAQGRCDAPLLSGDALAAGQYELAFHVADYFRRKGVKLPDPPFLSTVVIRIGIADAGAHYHVPLLATPWSYSTYRGG
jgi:5-hydroxyisourate hydrolase